MAQPYHGWWRQQSWGQWPAEDAAEKFEKIMEKLQEKCDWLRKKVNEQSDEMQRLDTQVALLGQENKDLRHRVAELEVAGSARMSGSSARMSGSAHTSDHEEDSPPVRIAAADASELPREVSQHIEEFVTIKWKPHPEAKARPGGARATSRGGACRNCHGGMLLDLEKEKQLQEMWNDYPLQIWPWVSHLCSTLFASKGTRHWKDLERKLTKREGRFLVWGSMKPNQRCFVCQCGECDAIITAEYAKGDDEEDFKDARDTLSKFVIGKPAEDSKRT